MPCPIPRRENEQGKYSMCFLNVSFVFCIMRWRRKKKRMREFKANLYSVWHAQVAAISGVPGRCTNKAKTGGP